MDRSGQAILVGAAVAALNGEVLGAVHAVHPHYFLVEGEGPEGHAEYEVPNRAVGAVEGGRVVLSVNREALTVVPSEHQSAAHRMSEEETRGSK